MQEKRSFSRRDFLQHAQYVGVAVVVGGISSEPTTLSPTIGRLRLDQARAEDFANHLHETFEFQDSDGTRHQVQLVRVKAHRSAGPRSGVRQPFSLVFHLHGSAAIPHRIYAVDHPQLGRLDLFLGAVGPRAAGTRLEAVFG